MPRASSNINHLVPVAQRVDSAAYPLANSIGFPSVYSLDRDLSSG